MLSLLSHILMISVGYSLHPHRGIGFKRLYTYETEKCGPLKSTSSDTNVEDLGGPTLKFFGTEESIQGYRNYNEDTFVHSEDFIFSAVFDGHGGSEVSSFLKNFYNDETIKEITELSGKVESEVLAEELKKSLIRADNDENVRKMAIRRGSTAALLLLNPRGDKIDFITANLGDSRIVLAKAGGIATDLTVDHKPKLERERRRVESLGGYVEWDNRIGGLAMSRAVGKY